MNNQKKANRLETHVVKSGWAYARTRWTAYTKMTKQNVTFVHSQREKYFHTVNDAIFSREQAVNSKRYYLFGSGISFEYSQCTVKNTTFEEESPRLMRIN